MFPVPAGSVPQLWTTRLVSRNLVPLLSPLIGGCSCSPGGQKAPADQTTWSWEFSQLNLPEVTLRGPLLWKVVVELF